MTIALSIANGRIAPVFDVAGRILLIPPDASHEDGDPPPDATIMALPPEASAPGRILLLERMGVRVLVCGAISRPAHELALSRGLEVRAFVAGDVWAVFRAWRHDRLHEPEFAMPGCRGRTCRRRNPFAEEEKEDVMKGKGQGNRNMGRGGGQGPGQGGGAWGGQGQGPRAGQGGNACPRNFGRSAGRVRDSAGEDPGVCRCPECGQRIAHQRGLPCVQRPCPACGAVMIRDADGTME